MNTSRHQCATCALCEAGSAAMRFLPISAITQSRWRGSVQRMRSTSARPTIGACELLCAACQSEVDCDTSRHQCATCALCEAGSAATRFPPISVITQNRPELFWCRIKSGGRAAPPARFTPPRNAGRDKGFRRIDPGVNAEAHFRPRGSSLPPHDRNCLLLQRFSGFQAGIYGF